MAQDQSVGTEELAKSDVKQKSNDSAGITRRSGPQEYGEEPGVEPYKEKSGDRGSSKDRPQQR